jgi:hypothetical protein
MLLLTPSRLAALLILSVPAAAPAQSLVLSVVPEKAAYELGEPVSVRVTMRNAGSQNVMVIPRLDATDGVASYVVVRPDGTRQRFVPAWRAELLTPAVALTPGASVDGLALLYGSSRGPSFDAPGTYQVIATYGGMASAPASLQVQAPASAQAEAQGRLLLAPDVQLFLLARGGESFADARRRLEQVVTGPSPLLTAYGQLALGAYLARDARDFAAGRVRPASPVQAIAYLRSALQQPMGRAMAAQASAHLVSAYERGGDAVRADSVYDVLRRRSADDVGARTAVRELDLLRPRRPPP